MSDNQKLPLLQRVAFGTGHVLNIMTVMGLWYPYSVVYFERVMQLSSSSTATILLITQVIGAVVTPFIGIWSDQCVCKYGRRKIFHLIGVLCVACSFFFIWYPCIGCADVAEPFKVLYYSSFVAVFQFGWASTQICQLALIPELTSDKHVKVELNSIRYGVQVVSALFVFILMWILLATLDHGLKDPKHFDPGTKTTFWVLALIVIIVGFIATLPFQIFVREKAKVNLKKLEWYKWLQNPQFYLVICTFIVAKLVTVIPLTYIPFYLLETLGMDKTSIAIGPLVLFVTSCILTPFAKLISKYVGLKLVYLFGIIVVWVAMLWIRFHPSRPIPASASTGWIGDDIYLAVILFGIGGTAISVVGLTLLSLLVGENTGSSAFVYGWAYFADRLSNGIVNNIILRIHIKDEPAFYRSVIVYTSLSATIMGLIAIILIKAHETWQMKRKNIDNEHPISVEDEVNPHLPSSETNYGTIQNDDSESTVPLLNGIDSGSIPINDTRGEQKQPIAHTMESPPEGAQDKTDTITDPNGELRDLSIYKSM